MKRNSVNSPGNSNSKDSLSGAVGSDQGADFQHENWGPEQEQNDPAWNLLGEASSREPSAFFARNVVREARLQESSTTTISSWGARVAAFFTPAKLTLGAAACACAIAAMAAYQMWPTPEAVMIAGPVVENSQPEPSKALSELVIEESLNVAAEDPTIFTRDEVVAMIGF